MANCMQAVIGIGSNMGDRLKNINGAVRSLSRLPKTKITACSHVYETKPMGYEDQSMFYNAAVTVETELSAQMLLGACLGIEGAYGRIRTIKDGPRVLDLDLLLYEGMKSESFLLTLPHPGRELLKCNGHGTSCVVGENYRLIHYYRELREKSQSKVNFAAWIDFWSRA